MHWFLDPITNHYADFSGRATRQQYWMFVLVHFLLMLGLTAVLGVLVMSGVLRFGLAWVLFMLVGLALFLPALAISVRRLHDVGYTGWLILLGLIPYVGALVLLVFYCLPGKPGQNAYGPDLYGGVAPAPTPAAAPAAPAATDVPPAVPPASV